MLSRYPTAIANGFEDKSILSRSSNPTIIDSALAESRFSSTIFRTMRLVSRILIGDIPGTTLLSVLNTFR